MPTVHVRPGATDGWHERLDPGPNVVSMVGGAAQQGLADTDRALAQYLRKEVAPYSRHYGQLLRVADGPQRSAITGVQSLVRLPFTTLDDIADPGALVLRPDASRISSAGDLKLTARLSISKAAKREAAFNRDLDRLYKPILWVTDGGITIGASAADERRLGDLGRQWLEGAGVRPYDSLVSVVPPGPSLGFWHLWHGARTAGLSALYLASPPPPEELIGLQPGVLAGSAADLLDLLEAASRHGKLAQLRTLLIVGGSLDDATRKRLEETASSLAGSRVAAVAGWAPPGVRALWVECRGSTGVHLWPGAEVVEVVDRTGERVPLGEIGEIVWTPIGWHGSVILRLRTGVRGRIDTTRCASCGAGETLIPVEPVRTEPAVSAASPEPRSRRGLASLADLARGKRRG